MKSVLIVLRLQGALPNLPEMISDEEAQRTARKSALIVARMKDGSFRWGFYFVWKCWQLQGNWAECNLKLSGRRCWPTWTTPGLLTPARTCLPAPRLTLTLFRSEHDEELQLEVLYFGHIVYICFTLSAGAGCNRRKTKHQDQGDLTQAVCRVRRHPWRARQAEHWTGEICMWKNIAVWKLIFLLLEYDFFHPLNSDLFVARWTLPRSSSSGPRRALWSRQRGRFAERSGEGTAELCILFQRVLFFITSSHTRLWRVWSCFLYCPPTHPNWTSEEGSLMTETSVPGWRTARRGTSTTRTSARSGSWSPRTLQSLPDTSGLDLIQLGFGVSAHCHPSLASLFWTQVWRNQQDDWNAFWRDHSEQRPGCLCWKGEGTTKLLNSCRIHCELEETSN